MISELNYKDITSLDTLHRLQGNLHCLTGLAFDFVDLDGKHEIGDTKFEVELCRLVHKTPIGRQACQKCGAEARKECLASNKPVVQVCHLGLCDVLVPLIIRSKVIGLLSAGQFLIEPPTTEGLQKVLLRFKELKINVKTLQAEKCYFGLPICPREKVEAIISLLTEFSVYITDAEHRLSIIKQHTEFSRMRYALDFIKSRFQENPSAEDIAAAAHVSPSHLRKLFRQAMRASPVAYLNNYRLDVAADLLEKTDMQVIQIAYQVGIESVSHFNHLFKKRFHESPSQYRESNSALKHKSSIDNNRK